MPGFVALSNHGDLLIRDAFRILLFFTEFSLNFLLRSSHPGVFLGKGVLENMQQIYRITPIRSVISIATLLKSHFDMGVLL